VDAFFAITLSIIVLRMWWKSVTRKPNPRELQRNTVKSRWDRKRIKAEKLKQEAKLARKIDKEKSKQNDTEVITVILPTINHDR
jgi:hypothetical protein